MKFNSSSKRSLIHLYIVPFIFALLLFSCSKDQRIVNKLKGTWTVTNFTPHDFYTEGTKSIRFDACDLDETEDNYCTGEINETLVFTQFGGGKTYTRETITYLVRDKGRELELTHVNQISNTEGNGFVGDGPLVSCESNCTMNYEIVELTDSILIFEGIDVDGNLIRFEAEK